MRFLKDYWVSNLKPGMSVNNMLLAVISIEKAKTRTGSEYLKMLLSDKAGVIDARVWDEMYVKEMAEYIDEDSIVSASGEIVEYNGLQFHVHNCSMVPKKDCNIQDFIPSAQRNIEEMKEQLGELILTVGNEDLRAFLLEVFSGSFLEEFSLAVGGKIIHHNYLGGLIEHTLEVAAQCETLCNQQGKHLNRDILLAGALLHDIGKIFEYDKASFVIKPNEEAKMVGGHIILGRDYVRDRFESSGLPEKNKQHIEHLILSHHGKMEWGAVIEPQTIEAVALHYADLISARVNQVSLVIDRDRSCENWTNFDKYLQKKIKLYKNDDEDLF